jgi:hypothetical protein
MTLRRIRHAQITDTDFDLIDFEPDQGQNLSRSIAPSPGPMTLRRGGPMTLRTGTQLPREKNRLGAGPALKAVRTARNGGVGLDTSFFRRSATIELGLHATVVPSRTMRGFDSLILLQGACPRLCRVAQVSHFLPNSLVAPRILLVVVVSTHGSTKPVG